MLAFQQRDRHQQTAFAKQDAMRLGRNTDRAARQIGHGLRRCGRRSRRRRGVRRHTGPEGREAEHRAGSQGASGRAERAGEQLKPENRHGIVRK